MKFDVNYLYDNLHSFDDDQIKDLITFLGNIFLDDPRALIKENSDKICPFLPFNVYYVKKLLSTTELKETYFDNSLFEKDEEIESLDLANIILPLYPEFKISRAILPDALTNSIPEALTEFYIEQIKKIGAVLFCGFCSKNKKTIIRDSKIFTSLDQYFKEQDSFNYFVNMPSEFLDKHEYLKFLLPVKDSDIDVPSIVGYLTEKFDSEEYVPLILELKDKELKKKLASEILKTKDLSYFDDDHAESLVFVLSSEELSSIASFHHLKGNNLFFIYNVLLKHNLPLFFDEADIVESNMYFEFANKTKNKRFLLEILKFIQSKNNAEALTNMLKFFAKEDVSMLEFCIDQLEPMIKEHNIFINHKVFVQKIAKTEDPSSEDFNEVSKVSLHNIVIFLQRNKVSLDTFKMFYQQLYDAKDQYAIDEILSDVALNQECQEYLFNIIPLNKKVEFISKFDLISDDLFLSLVNDDEFKNELKTKKILFNQKQMSILAKQNLNLDEDMSFSLLKSLIKRGADSELIEKLMKQVEPNTGLFKEFLNSQSHSLIMYGLISEYFFNKYIMSSLHSQHCTDILMSSTFNYVSSEDYPKLQSGIHKIPNYYSEVAFSNLVKVVEASEDPNFLFSYLPDSFLSDCYEKNKYFKNQKSNFIHLDSYSPKSIKYLINYTKDFKIKTIIQSLGNRDISHFYSEIKELMDQNDPIVAQSDIAHNLIITHQKDFLQYLTNISKDASEETIKEIFRIFDDTDVRKIDYINKELASFLINKVKISDKRLFRLIFESKVLSLKEMISLMPDKEKSENLFESLDSESHAEYVRLLRTINPSWIPEDKIVSFDLSVPDQTWDFYIAGSSEIIDATEDVKKIFFTNLNNSFNSKSVKFNPKLLKVFEFKPEILTQILYSDINNILASGLSEESLNKDVLLSLIKSNPSVLEKDKTLRIDHVIDFYKLGMKDIFKYDVVKPDDIRDSDLVELLNETLDVHLMEFYKKHWKIIASGSYSFYEKFNPKVSKILASTITEEDISKEVLEFRSDTVKFEMADIDIVSLYLDKKTGKFKFLSGYRKDLAKVVKAKYLEINEKFPLKITGTVDLEDKKFIAKTEVDYEFKFSNSDDEKLSYMKELGFEGNLTAVAKRQPDFNYVIEIMFEQKTTVSSKSIEQVVKAKTFDINKKLKELLKVSPKRKFGFELELVALDSTRTDIKKRLSKEGFKIDISHSYRKSSGKTWDFKEDGSLDASSYENDYHDEDSGEEESRTVDAFEIASPILCGREGISEATKFLDSLFRRFDIESGQEINAGLHVHHDISDINELEINSKSILESYLPFQETLYSLVEDYRSENDYCAKIDPENPIEGRHRGSAATGIILTDFGTMEFRMKEGLTDTKTIINWILYTQNVVDLVYIKLTDKIEKFSKKIEKMSETSVYMLLDANSYGKIDREKIKKFRKLVGFQEALYAQN